MDETAFHRTRIAVNVLPCVFEKALLAGCAQCRLSAKHALADREVITCTQNVAHINCSSLNSLFRERAMFALRLQPARHPITHANMLKLQCGGISGVHTALNAANSDIHALIQDALAQHASLLELPWQQIVDTICAWESKQRNKKKPHSV